MIAAATKACAYCDDPLPHDQCLRGVAGARHAPLHAATAPMMPAIDALVTQIDTNQWRHDLKVAKYDRLEKSRGERNAHEDRRLVYMRQQLEALHCLLANLFALSDEMLNTKRDEIDQLEAIISAGEKVFGPLEASARTTKNSAHTIYVPRYAPNGSEKTLARPWVCVCVVGGVKPFLYLEDKFGNLRRYATEEYAQHACNTVNRTLTAGEPA